MIKKIRIKLALTSQIKNEALAWNNFLCFPEPIKDLEISVLDSELDIGQSQQFFEQVLGGFNVLGGNTHLSVDTFGVHVYASFALIIKNAWNIHIESIKKQKYFDEIR